MSDENLNIDIEKVVRHWIETSDEDYQTMLSLFDSKSYGWSLFLGHISIEKLLKAYFVGKYKKHAPFSHNLYRLAEQMNTLTGLIRLRLLILTPVTMITKENFIHYAQPISQRNGLGKLQLSDHG